MKKITETITGLCILTFIGFSAWNYYQFQKETLTELMTISQRVGYLGETVNDKINCTLEILRSSEVSY